MKNNQPLLGFAILSHNNPAQLLRLARKLSMMFNKPPITIHHDFSQCEIDKDEFPANVEFVVQSVVTKWGDWSLVEATMLAIKKLHKRTGHPEWIIFLSGNDYPIQQAERTESFYREAQFDAFVSSKKLTGSTLSTKREVYWFVRYHWPKIYYPSVFHIIKSIKKRKMVKEPILLKGAWAQRFLTPFNSAYPCYGGSFWFSVNRKAAKALVETFENDKRLCRYLKNTPLPEEAFFVTVLNNEKNLNVHSFNYRFIDWAKNVGPHPKQLTLSDLPALQRSKEHFARKIDLETDADLLDELDKRISS